MAIISLNCKSKPLSGGPLRPLLKGGGGSSWWGYFAPVSQWFSENSEWVLDTVVEPTLQFLGETDNAILVALAFDLAFLGIYLGNKYCPGLLWDAWSVGVQVRTPLGHVEVANGPDDYLREVVINGKTYWIANLTNWNPELGSVFSPKTAGACISFTKAGLNTFHPGTAYPFSLGFTIRFDPTKVIWYTYPDDDGPLEPRPGYVRVWARAAKMGYYDGMDWFNAFERFLIHFFNSPPPT